MINSNSHKKKHKNISLYKKEQLVITVLLFCFGLTAMLLPQTQKQPTPNKYDISEEVVLDNNISDTNKKDTEESIVIESVEPESTDTAVSHTEYDNNVSSSTVPNDALSEKESSAEGSNASTPASPPSSDSSQKIWVPPVYEIVHHDAVYETKQIVICNYCSETFDTVGEFQVHKNAHGG